MKKVLLLTICLMMVVGSGGCTQQQWDMWKKMTQHPQERRQQYINANPELPAKTVKYILAGKIFIGMTREQVLASCGRPRDINRTVGSWGVDEQWIYGYSSNFNDRVYLYFENDILTSYQD